MLSKKYFLKLIIPIVLILTLILSSFNIAKSGLDEERKKLAQYQAQLDEIKKNIVSVEKSSKEISSLVNSLNQELASLEKEIAQTQEKINSLQNEITKKEKEIASKELEIEKRQAELESVLSLSYELSKISPVEILYEGKDPEAVSKRITYISYISNYTDQLMKQAMKDKEELENYKAQLSSTKKDYEAVLNEKKQQESILNEELDMKNRLLNTLKEKKTYLLYKQSELEEEIKKEEELIQKLIEEERKKGIYAGTFIWPVTGPVTSEFGMRLHPILHIMRFHNGIDIAVPTGTPVKASASGTVIEVGYLEGYGNVVIISHGENFSTLYSHLQKAVVKVGQEVKQGQVIAYSDNTGMSTGPHLHFSIFKIDPQTGKSIAVNPRDYLP